MLIFYILLTVMILGSIIAIETRSLLSSVIAAGIVGYILSIMFLLLGAPDLAITQVVVEILALIVLIRATVVVDDTTIEKHRDTFAIVSSLVFLGLFMVFASYAFLELPPFGQPLMRTAQHYLDKGLAETGASNMVAAVILDYRGYDTLGEATVIFVSILGSMVLMRRIGRIRRSEIDVHSSEK